MIIRKWSFAFWIFEIDLSQKRNIAFEIWHDNLNSRIIRIIIISSWSSSESSNSSWSESSNSSESLFLFQTLTLLDKFSYRRVRLSVRTRPSQGRETGSIPVRATINHDSFSDHLQSTERKGTFQNAKGTPTGNTGELSRLSTRYEIGRYGQVWKIGARREAALPIPTWRLPRLFWKKQVGNRRPSNSQSQHPQRFSFSITPADRWRWGIGTESKVLGFDGHKTTYRNERQKMINNNTKGISEFQKSSSDMKRSNWFDKCNVHLQTIGNLHFQDHRKIMKNIMIIFIMKIVEIVFRKSANASISIFTNISSSHSNLSPNSTFQ